MAPLKEFRASLTLPRKSMKVNSSPRHTMLATFILGLIWRVRNSAPESPAVLPSVMLPLRLIAPVAKRMLSKSVG
jgi:hypothetical protein